jgi:hypothetical protein
MLGLTIEFDEKSLTTLMESFQGMHDSIEHLKRIDIGQTMSDWQMHDMHRRRPFTMRFRAAGKAVTKIRPHSLWRMLKSEGVALTSREQRAALRAIRKNLKYPRRHKRHKALTYGEHQHWSTRPILRAELISLLMERVVSLALEKLSWKPEPLHGAEAFERHLAELQQRARDVLS